jgi:hypothetical protein
MFHVGIVWYGTIMNIMTFYIIMTSKVEEEIMSHRWQNVKRRSSPYFNHFRKLLTQTVYYLRISIFFAHDQLPLTEFRKSNENNDLPDRLEVIKLCLHDILHP